ncbi:MAG TPA: amidohydrolase family protein [Chitinispirillaceae bacterium]|nr:amidohydrolase family protein [Chitinispirillaceae bacterium]
MIIIDFHTHIFPDDLAERAITKLTSYSPETRNYTDGTAGGLLDSMKKNGISHSVLLSIATKPSQVHIINQTAQTLQSQQFTPFGTLHPDMENAVEEIEFLKKSAIKGVKFHPEYQDFYITDPKLFPIYEQLEAEGFIVQFHAGKDPGPFSCDHALPADLRKIHKQFPKMTIIAAHLGGWGLWDDVEKELCGLPIFFDTSATAHYIDPVQCKRIIQKHGVEHILFGSDSPWFDQGDALRWIMQLPLTNHDIECILGKNALNVLA